MVSEVKSHRFLDREPSQNARRRPHRVADVECNLLYAAGEDVAATSSLLASALNAIDPKIEYECSLHNDAIRNSRCARYRPRTTRARDRHPAIRPRR